MTPEDLARALEGDRLAMAALVKRLRPVIQAEVGYTLKRSARPLGRDPREEVRDGVQEVFVQLLANGGKVLKSWDPERGRSLDSFVRLVARRAIAGMMRSRRKNPWSEQPLSAEQLEPHLEPQTGLSAQIESSQRLERLLEALRERLDVRGMLLFEMLYVEEAGVEDVCAATEMTRDAVYAWRARFKKLIQQLAEQERGAA